MEKIAIGIMSGTSLDGIDVVLAKIDGLNDATKISMMAFKTYPMPEDVLDQIKRAMHPKMSSAELLCSLNVRLAHVFADAAGSLCQSSGITLQDVDFIASHGQTIYHIPQHGSNLVTSSLQLGDGSVISQLTQTTVVSNFRNADIAQGGQGAPLVPFADRILFSCDHGRAIHNIGGISNLTYLPKDGDMAGIIAFDTGPGNMMIDYAMRLLYDLSYDEKGAIARSGERIERLYNQIMQHPYFNQKPPKSTGREQFGDQQTMKWIKPFLDHPKADIIRTLSDVVIDSIVESYQHHLLPNHELKDIIMCGGGAHNDFVIEGIRQGLPEIEVKMIEDLGYDSDAKEALAFIILGNQTIHHQPSNVPSATGAKRHAILGQISHY